ncbi:bile acid:sodium symporter family protein [Suttonella sp. R2A3]|uniref:bile acid:sodium symporter family protein n=1 Tax=Suttonella sp. R2A3 TaxID=2908648 RepID=UPI001F3A6956|nr:bile acid:sodium symporter family protein [Suttonella sp. R2A3]UJF23793.1 bile acid:sodium symporter family protein [Suttonella sp. R2A3]
MRALAQFSAWVGRTFALWAVLLGLAGFFFPDLFTPLKSLIVPALGVVMFGMGLTLKVEDFAEIAKRPRQVLVGLAAQFVIMPLLALLLVRVFNLDPAVALGVILVGCCPGGTSSNVITFLAKGDVALSVTITSFSTVLAPLLTPLLLQFYAGELIDIELLSMMITVAKIVLLPIILGVIVHRLLGEKIQPAIDVLPLVSVVAIVLIVAIVVALSHTKIAESGLLIFAVVVLHNILGYALGYLLARFNGFSYAQQRAIMVEVGMQNSGLGAALASKYFTPEAAVPSALFSVWHNISGALLASFCAKKEER